MKGRLQDGEGYGAVRRVGYVMVFDAEVSGRQNLRGGKRIHVHSMFYLIVNICRAYSVHLLCPCKDIVSKNYYWKYFCT